MLEVLQWVAMLLSFMDMWARLSAMACPKSWLVTEDFNAIMRTHERLYEALITYTEIRNFSECIQKL